MRLISIAVAAALLWSCQDEAVTPVDSGAPDAGGGDAVAPDVGGTDAVSDAGGAGDGGPADTGEGDADPADGGTIDGDSAADVAQAPPVVVEDGDLRLVLRVAEGTFDLSKGGRSVIEGATADALLDDGSGPRLVSMAGDCARSVDGLGRLVCAGDGLTLTLEVALHGDDGHMEARLEVTNTSGATVKLLRLAPLVIEAAHGGALWLGPDPARHRILENGSYVALDHAVQANWGDAGRFLLADALPIQVRGASISNWNHVVASIDDPADSLVAGWLTFERTVPTLGIAFDAKVGRGGPLPFTTYAAECALIFHGKPLASGASLQSERLWMALLPADPLEALERYADAVAAFNGIVPWPQRNGGQSVPNGWNSWTGSGSTGGYGTNIDEGVILDNLKVFAEQLGPFGGGWFQIDDGWEPAYGDWWWRTDRFPTGGAGMAEQIAATGMLPGLWIAAFSVDLESDLAKDHPDWLQMPGAFSTSGEGATVDTSKPEVLAWFTDLFTTIREDGWKWVKLDFSYQALLGDPSDTTLTNVESWRQGWLTAREALGPDIFLLGIGVMGTNIGIIDSMRLTLDTNPQWEGDEPDNPISAINSFKSIVRTGSRRWFYGNRVWVNHNDLIFFRASKEQGVPPLTFEESRTFATWVGLGGGIVKIGDKLVDLEPHPEQLDVLRRLLPAWPHGARPVDVLIRDYPEHWVLPVQAPAGDWTVVGLLNWGSNRDFSQRPAAALPDGPHGYTVRCAAECLAWELWSETFLGVQTGDFEVEVEARDAKVIALRAPTGAPQFLGTNRHVTMGATDMGPITWDPAPKTLSGTLVGSVGTDIAPWEHRLAFYAPAPFSVIGATVAGIDAPVVEQDGEVVRLRFTLPPAAQGADVAWSVGFGGE